jgi:adenine-specific DNA-methyltransferase
MPNNKIKISIKKIHNMGQYFTKNDKLKEILFNLILNKPSTILEPSIGRGDLIDYITNKVPTIKFDMYEIDRDIDFLDVIDKNLVVFGDFLMSDITKHYDTIVGNPPYVRTSSGNLYLNFIEKCFNLLNNNGELIFIVPYDFLKLTSSSKILTTLMQNGTFTHLYHSNDENLFENASIDVIIFRYCKNPQLEKKIICNEQLMTICFHNGTISFDIIQKTNINKVLVSDYFDVHVGMVSGRDSIYKNHDLGNIDILTSYNNIEKYIYIDKYPSGDHRINEYLLTKKNELMSRGIRKFNENNWFEWGALRNMKKIAENMGKECIYIYNLSRKKIIAFKSHVQYFGGNLLILIPKTMCNLDKIVKYLNTDTFKSNYTSSGRFKIGQKLLYNSYIDTSYL